MTPPTGETRGQRSLHDTGEFLDVDQLARRLAAVARSLDDAEDGVDGTLMEIALSAVDTVPGARWGSITEVRRSQELSVRLATDPVARKADEVQYATKQGPCLDAAYRHVTVRVDDLRHDERWPAFGAAAAELGPRSMLSLQLYVEHQDLGALNLYADHVEAFTDESEHVGLMYAAHAAVAMDKAQQLGHLQQALVNRDTIGMAKGILMQHFRVTGDAAFDMLRRLSQDMNVKLHEVARQVVETGSLGDVRRPT